MGKLQRRLGLGAVIAISISAMLGSGIFVLPGIAVSTTGPSLWLAYLISALGVLPAALSKAELATAMPASGGTYVYLNRTFGPLVGTVAGLGLGLSLLLKSSFALVGFGAYLSVLTNFSLQYMALGMLSFIVVINIFGVGKVSKSLGVIVGISISGLFLLSMSGMMKVEPQNFQPFMTHGFSGLIEASALVFVSFAGVTKVAAIAEEIKEPERNLPRGILWSLFIVTVIYCGVNFVLMGILSQDKVEGNLKPIYTLAETLGGHYVGLAAAILGILTMVSMANAGLLAASRFPFAMSRDALLPNFLGKLHSRFLTPSWSIVISGLVIGLSIVFLEVSKIVKLASAFMLIIYMSENLAVIVLRETRVQWYKPSYRSPLYPWVQVVGIFSGVFLLSTMFGIIPLALLSIGVPGVLLYFLYSRKRTTSRGVIGMRGQRKDLVESVNESVGNYCLLEDIDMEEGITSVTALFGKEKSPEFLVEIATALSQSDNIEIVHLTEVPEQIIFTDLGAETPMIRSLRRRFKAMEERTNHVIDFNPIVTHDIYKAVNDITQRLECNWLVMEWRGRSQGTMTIHSPIGWLKDHLTCNLATFKHEGIRYFKKILVIVDDRELSPVIINTADTLAQVYGSEITFVRIMEEELVANDLSQEMERLNGYTNQCKSTSKSHIKYGANVLQTMIAHTVEFDLVVIEDTRNQSVISRLRGTQLDKFIKKAACSVLSILPKLEDPKSKGV